MTGKNWQKPVVSATKTDHIARNDDLPMFWGDHSRFIQTRGMFRPDLVVYILRNDWVMYIPKSIYDEKLFTILGGYVVKNPKAA